MMVDLIEKIYSFLWGDLVYIPLPGGSTLGNLLSHSFSVPMVDIGLPQLAMHSAVETAAVTDADAMVRAVAGFYRVHLRSLGDARYTLE